MSKWPFNPDASLPSLPERFMPPPSEKLSIHDQIIRCLEQAGHPDWSLQEMIERLKQIAKDASPLERRLREAERYASKFNLDCQDAQTRAYKAEQRTQAAERGRKD